MIYNVLFIQKDGVGMAGNWDFTADSDIQTELSSKLNEAADKYDAKVEAMYKEIESLGSNSYWVGEDYDAFKTGTEGYKTALKDLSDGIRMYGTHFETMATGTDTLASELIAIIQNMTGSGNGGGTSGGGTGNGGTGSGNSSDDSDTSTTNGSGSTNPDNSTDDTDYIGGDQKAIDGGDVGDENYQTSTETADDSEPSKLEEVGSRYVNDWNKFTSSVSGNWSNVDGLISGTGAALATGLDGVEGLGDMVFDTVHAVDTGVESGINWVLDAGTSRDYNFVEDVAENWDYSTCDNAWEYVGTTVGALGRTTVDLAQGACNLATGAIDFLGDAAKGVWDFIF